MIYDTHGHNTSFNSKSWGTKAECSQGDKRRSGEGSKAKIHIASPYWLDEKEIGEWSDTAQSIGDEGKVKGLMVPRLLMKMVPYTLANAWPVSWLKD
jgi:hypothetical protein